jgi:diguanylate cyclase (GGDEF)-like protein/PAS domain S-box-containing protein
MALVSLDGEWLRVNHALCTLIGHDEDALLGMTFQEITHPDDLDADLNLVQQLVDGDIATYDLEKRYVRADGRVVWTVLSVSLVRDDAGQPLYFVSQIQDIHDRKELESDLAHRSLHDPLTGLPNRTLLLDRLAQAADRPRPAGATFAVLFVDVDGFKAVNDDLGHAAGDELLVEVGARLSRTVRGVDTVARFGGDEFVVIAELASPSHADVLARRLTSAVSDPMTLSSGAVVRVGASVGVAVHGSPHDDVESMLTEADADMYRVKRAGREVAAGLA